MPQTLTASQEAHLDVQSYPWYPCVWHISCLLTARARHQLHIRQQQEQELDAAADAWEPAKRLRSQGSAEAGTADDDADWSEERATHQLLAELPAMDPAASSRLSAQHSAFRMLTTPITACGIGLRFKRGPPDHWCCAALRCRVSCILHVSLMGTSLQGRCLHGRQEVDQRLGRYYWYCAQWPKHPLTSHHSVLTGSDCKATGHGALAHSQCQSTTG